MQRKFTFYFVSVLILLALIVILTLYFFPIIHRLIGQTDTLKLIFFDAAGLHQLSLTFLGINLAIFLSACVIDIAVSGWPASALKRLFIQPGGSARGDLWCWVLSLLNLYDFFTLLFSCGLFYVLSVFILKVGNFQLISYLPSAYLQFAVVFCLSDFKQYLWHRFMHRQPFWELHKYHHAATEFNLITNSRGHFLEKGILMIFDSMLFSLLGSPLVHFAIFMFFREFYNQLLHSDVDWHLGWFGDYVLISPRAHKLHHGKASKYYDKNFGTFFVFWDKLFGTYAKTEEPITIGIEDNQYNRNGFWRDMLTGSRKFVFRAGEMIRNKLIR